jgi:hypothetical protein
MIVTFRSTAFNTSSPEKHFVSVRAFGSDLANWLIHELARRDAAVEPMISHKDVGWIVRFNFRGAAYNFLILYRHPAWLGLLERRRGIFSRGILARIFRAQPKNVEFDALRLIDEVLSSSDLISDVRWHYDEPDGLISDGGNGSDAVN